MKQVPTDSRKYTLPHQPLKRFRSTFSEADVDLDVLRARGEGGLISLEESKGLSRLLGPSSQTLSSFELDVRNSDKPKKQKPT